MASEVGSADLSNPDVFGLIETIFVGDDIPWRSFATGRSGNNSVSSEMSRTALSGIGYGSEIRSRLAMRTHFIKDLFHLGGIIHQGVDPEMDPCFINPLSKRRALLTTSLGLPM